MASLDGKVALITGAARGQGAAEARLFAKRGAKVMLCDVLDAEGQAVAAEIGANAAYMRLDVTSESAWKEVVAATVAKFGKLNVLINNAGIITPVKEIGDTGLAEYMKVVQVNQVGVFLGMREVVEPMKKAGGGSIVNISSISGMVGMVSQAAYQASKGAVRMLTKSCAVDYAKYNIRVNSVHPGAVRTPIINVLGDDTSMIDALVATTIMKRMADPIELSYAVLLLASDESSYMTGSELVVDGGWTAA